MGVLGRLLYITTEYIKLNIIGNIFGSNLIESNYNNNILAVSK